MGRSDLRVLHDADQVGSTLTFAASKAMFRRRPQSSCSAVSCRELPCFVNSQVRKLPPTSPKTGMNLLCRVCELRACFARAALCSKHQQKQGHLVCLGSTQHVQQAASRTKLGHHAGRVQTEAQKPA